MFHILGKRRSRGFHDYLIKALLFGLPITWLVFALEMTVLSVDRESVLISRADQQHMHKSVEDFQIAVEDTGQNHVAEKVPELQANGLDSSPGSKAKFGDSHRNSIRGKVADDSYRNSIRKSVRNDPAKKEQGGRGMDSVHSREGQPNAGLLGGDSNPKDTGGQADREAAVEEVVRRFDPPKRGEGGGPVNVDPRTLTAEEKRRYEEGYKNHNFNEYASDLISVQRTVPDFKPAECSHNDYSSKVELQQASIIMCFYNEAWSALLRSVHSVLDRSPPHLLKELILVDDFSDAEHLKSKLDSYMADFPKVKILRMPERVGLVRARLKGVEVAQAPILIFLDSHIECAEGWMEPLIYEVSKNSTVAVTPIIDIIDKDSMAIVQAVESIGVVELRQMTFTWSRLTPRISRMRGSPGSPFMSPTMAGGLFAINKKFFQQLGTWDPGLVLWGGENLELSFKLWMCGGAILIHPCSRVSHIFRDKSPYLKTNVDRIVKGNAARVAEVWLDNYKRFFFYREAYDPNTYGDVSGRKELRHVLACHSFQWYVDNVYPELFIDGTGKHLGHIKSASGLCLRFKDENRRDLILTPECPSAVLWQTSKTKEIRYINTCLEQYQGHVFANICDSQEENQAFEVVSDNIQGDQVSIFHVPSGLCLSALEMGHTGTVALAPCLYGDARQVWQFKKNPLPL